MGLHCNGQIIQNDEFVVAEIQGIGFQNLPNERIKTNEFLTEIDMDIDTYMEKETREFVKTRLPSIGAEKVSSHGDAFTKLARSTTANF